MTDPELATGAVQVNQIELAARACLVSATSEVSDRAAAHDTLRQAVALRRALERWIIARAVRGTIVVPRATVAHNVTR